MKRKKKVEKSSTKAHNPSWVRASISFPPALYRSLEGVAKQKKVSLAWVVRDAAEMYIAQSEKPENEHIQAAALPHAPATASSSRRG